MSKLLAIHTELMRHCRKDSALTMSYRDALGVYRPLMYKTEMPA